MLRHTHGSHSLNTIDISVGTTRQSHKLINMFDVDTNLLNTAGLREENSFFLNYLPSLKLFFLFCFAIMMKRKNFAIFFYLFRWLCRVLLLSLQSNVLHSVITWTNLLSEFAQWMWTCVSSALPINFYSPGYQCNYSRLFILFLFSFPFCLFFIKENFFIFSHIFFTSKTKITERMVSDHKCSNFFHVQRLKTLILLIRL